MFRRALVVVTALLAACALGAAPARADTQSVTIDGTGGGRTFDGVGALSASSLKLLYDYPEPQRSQVLDLLFKPHYGASLDTLKVEIGGDSNSTTSSEPSHERLRGQVDCHSGIEWWLMKQAKLRDPDIKLYGLMWTAPGWLSGFYSQDQVDYLMDWMRCAQENGLHIDYLGGSNERGPSQAQFRSFYRALGSEVHSEFPGTKVVATDEHHPPDYWRAATWLKSDPVTSNAVDIIGEHDPCVWLSTYEQCNGSQDALDTGKPLWASEQSAAIDGDGADALARAMNRLYIDARVTGNINWALNAGMYPDTATAGTGLILTTNPWSGAYEVTKDVWVDAQTTQFTAPGWRYVDDASGYLPGGASYVTLRDPATGDYTVVVETTDATGPETVDFTTTGGLSDGTVHEWSTDLTSERPSDWFVHTGDITPAGGGFQATFQPGRVYTLSTTTGQRNGTPPQSLSTAEQLPVPFHANFEDVAPGEQARYFQNVQGGFEAAPCQGGRTGTCYRQAVTLAPLTWHATRMEPTTIAGDPRWWGDYQVGVDALLEQPGWVDVVGRIENYDGASVAGYHFQVSDTGDWKLYTEDQTGTDTTLASGSGAPLGVGSWHRLGLSFRGSSITATVDDRPIAQVTDTTHTTGQVGLGVSPYQNAEYDNLTVTPSAPRPEFIPHDEMTASATSENLGAIEYHRYPARYAIDDRVESRWMTQVQPEPDPLPQSITLDLGRSRAVSGLAYKPPFDRRVNNADDITGYTIALSDDGRSFRTVASGTWEATMATKLVTWPQTGARYVRLEATSSPSGTAAASELNVLGVRRRG